MKNNAKKFPLPTGEQWSRLPERVLALETAPKPKIFRATINQDGGNPPVVSQEVENTTGANFTFEYNTTGEYRVVTNIPIFTSREKVIVTLSSGKEAVVLAYNYRNENRIDIYTFSPGGNLENSLLVDNKITIEILD